MKELSLVEEEEVEDSNVHFTQKRNNSSSESNMFSTHLSGDEVQCIVLGSRPLFLSGPSPPGAPLRPHVSSKILGFKTKIKQNGSEQSESGGGRGYYLPFIRGSKVWGRKNLASKVHYLLASGVSTSSSLRISLSSCVSMRLSRAHLPTCALAAFKSQSGLKKKKLSVWGVRSLIFIRRTFSWGVGRFPCI